MAYTYKYGDRPLDDFTIQRAVGTGGFGEVYYAMSDGGREVALKYLKSSPEVELRGVSNCINLKSPHLVSIFDVKKNADGEYFIVMEYCSGPSLRDLLIAEPNGFGPEKAAFFVREIAKGLSYLHDRGIVHRDLKPGNIFYDDGYVKIGDYGLSKFIAVSRHSAQTASVGTVHYMAPEIGSGNYSRGVDIYALGVMLYEMLLGKVPFEGSSLGEVLMKHLTSRPEVDNLPQPFARVIRKALEKDPKDRYQTVDEMVNELLEVETVRESLAGFSLKSLDDAVRRGMPDPSVSPIPSPNPFGPGFGGYGPGPRPAAAPLGPTAELPKRVADRIDRVSRKIDKRMAKLSGEKAPRRHGGSSPPAGQPVGGSAVPAPVAERRKRMLLSLSVSSAIALGLAILAGNNTNSEAVGISAFLVTIGMSLGVVLAQPVTRWFAAEEGPKWAQRFIAAGCSGIPMLIGTLPMMDSSGYGNAALPILIALLVVAVFGNWRRHFDPSEDHDVSIGSALWTGFGAFLVGVIAAGILEVGREEEVMFLAGGIAAAASLIVQINAWWLSAPAERLGRRLVERNEERYGYPPPPPRPRPVDYAAETLTPAAAAEMRRRQESGEPMAPASERPSAVVPADPNAHLRRWGVTRAVWGLFAFVMVSLLIVSSVALGMLEGLNRDDETGLILAIIATSSLIIFAMRKTTPLRRPGFWRETLRPGMLTVLMFLIGGLITGISRYWDCHSVGDEGRVAMMSGLVICSLVWLVLLFFTGRRKSAPRPFLHDDVGDSDSTGGAGSARPATAHHA